MATGDCPSYGGGTNALDQLGIDTQFKKAATELVDLQTGTEDKAKDAARSDLELSPMNEDDVGAPWNWFTGGGSCALTAIVVGPTNVIEVDKQDAVRWSCL